MYFLDKLKDKTHKKNYTNFLTCKNKLDDISSKVSLVKDKIKNLNNISLNSFTKAHNYSNKIIVAYNRNNIPLSKHGFIKYTKETLFLEKLNSFIKDVTADFNNLNDHLIELQNICSNFNEQLDFSLLNPLTQSFPISNFNSSIKKLEFLLESLEKKLQTSIDVFYTENLSFQNTSLDNEYKNFLSFHLQKKTST